MNDHKFSRRQLLKNPGFTTIAGLTLALGIGATTAVVSLVNALLIRPLPFRDPERLAWVANAIPGGSSLSAATTRAGTFAEWQDRNTSFERMGAYFTFFDYASQTLTGKGEPVRLHGVRVSQGFLETLGVRPQLGRSFSPEECEWNGAKVVILSDSLWKRRFDGDPAIVGPAISLRDDLVTTTTDVVAKIEPYVVAGVLPPAFDFSSLFTPASKVDVLLGLPLAYFATHAIAQTRAFDVALLSSVAVNGQALGFTMVVALACGILFGIVPALRLSRSVVGNVGHAGLDQATEPEMYLLGGKIGWSTEDLVVRTKASLPTLVPAVREALRQFDASMPAGEFRTLGEIIEEVQKMANALRRSLASRP